MAEGRGRKSEDGSRRPSGGDDVGVPCVTLRENTERPITVEMGSNVLGGTKRDSILAAYEETVNGGRRVCGVPPKWDGKAAERI
jgi:UDP-N-acetylglucosamine 2-epimerase (non-hydrolysing)